MEEVKSYATEQAAKQLQAHIKDIATGSEFITYTPDRIETRNYRFIIDGM
jgi:RNA 3'-terminal phosphate cyclase